MAAYVFTTTQTSTGTVLHQRTVVGDRRVLIAAMIDEKAPAHVVSWVHFNGDHRPMKWHVGTTTVRVVRR